MGRYSRAILVRYGISKDWHFCQYSGVLGPT
jgi:hypothetical protein